MRQTEEDQTNDLGRLLREVLPADGDQELSGQDLPEEGGWHGIEVSSIPDPVTAAGAGQRGVDTAAAPANSARRVGVVPMVLVAACIAVAAVGGYWLGTQRSNEAAEPAADDPATASAIAPSSSAEVQVSTTQQPSSTQPATTQPTEAGGSTTSLDSSSSLEALESQLATIDLSGIQFSPGTDRLTEAGQGVLDEVASILEAHPLIPTEVKVATFTQSTPGHNHGLSTLQARSIIEALIAADVDPGRLTSTGLGSAVARPRDGQTLLLFEADDPDLAAALAGMDTNVAAIGADGALTAEVSANLDLAIEAMAERNTSSLSLLAYAYTDSRARSHDLSHEILDEAVAYMTAAGADAERLSEVGMGQTSIDTGLETRVEIAVGLPAAISVAVSQIDTDAIDFEPGTGELTETSFALLADVATALKIDPTIAVEIAAHTYTEATSERNHDLSHTQGDAVVDALVDFGIARERFVVTGHGDPPHFARPGSESYITFRTLE
ncbi:MAG: OmpA family protein [Acidimicrobiales bacterium]